MRDAERTNKEPARESRAGSIPEAPLPNGVEIRAARPRDAASFLDIYAAVVAEHRFIRTEQVRNGVMHYRRLFRRSWTPEHARLVAVAGRDVIGSLSIERLQPAANRHVAALGMMVARKWRRQGVGAALLAAALRWAREAGVEKVSLEVYPGNEAAVGLYRKFGFQEEGRLVRQSKKSYGYEDEVVMALWMR